MGSKKVGNFGQQLEQKGPLLCSSASNTQIYEVDKSGIKAFYLDDEEANKKIPKVLELGKLHGKNKRIPDTVYACKLSQVNADGTTTPIESKPGSQGQGLKYSDDLPKVVYVCKKAKMPEYQERDTPDFPNMSACGSRRCGSRSNEALINQFKMDREAPCYRACESRQEVQRELEESIRIEQQQQQQERERRRIDEAGDDYAEQFTKWADREKYEEWATRERKVWPEYCTGDMGRASSFRQNKTLFNQAKRTLSSAASLRNQVLSRMDSDNGIVPGPPGLFGLFGKSSGRCPHCGGTKDLARTPVQIKSCNDVMPKRPAHLRSIHFEDDLDDVMYDDNAHLTQRFHFRSGTIRKRNSDDLKADEQECCGCI